MFTREATNVYSQRVERTRSHSWGVIGAQSEPGARVGTDFFLV